MANDDRVTVIEVTADYLLLIVLAEENIMNILIDDLNKKSDKTIKYVSVKIDDPSANKCAEECQKVFLPSASSQVNNFKAASLLIGRVASHTSPSIEAANTFFAKPSLIDLAIPNAVIPFS